MSDPESDVAEGIGRVLNPPERIFLVHGDLWKDEEHESLHRDGDVGWCDERVHDSDVEYVLASRAEALEAEAGHCIDPDNLHFVMSHPEAVARQMTRDTDRIKDLEAEVERLKAETGYMRDTLEGAYS